MGIFPFSNVGGQQDLEVWSRAFPSRLQSELLHAGPIRLDVYFDKVLKQLTNNAWNGQHAASRELTRKVGRELKLQKLVSGSYKQDNNGWQVEVRVDEFDAETNAQVLVFKEASTHSLLGSMGEKTCAALGVKPDPAYLETWRKHPISNAAIQKVAALRAADEAGGSKEEFLNGLREVLASEPDYFSARADLMRALGETKRMDEALVEARKLVEHAPGMCWGHMGVAVFLTGHGADEEREQALLQALKVHPGCPSAARILFPAWTSQARWDELKFAAEKAHEALPDEAISTAALAAALAGKGDREAAWELLDEIDTTDEEPEPALHSVLLQAAVGTARISMLSRELLWFQRCSSTNEWVRELVSQVDSSFWLRYDPDSAPTNPPPRQYSSPELQTELAKRLTSEERALVENPLLVTEGIAAEARTLTTGVTNPTTKAVVLLGYVIEERLRTEQQATNLNKTDRLPVCHQYASRLVSLARSVGMPAWLVHVDLAREEYSGYHDRAAIRLGDDLVMQFDPSLGTVGSARDQFRILDDVQAIAHHLLQENDLPRLRVAQKLDPDDRWTRVRVIAGLTDLDRVKEAEDLWNALGPEFTNRWDYYLTRAGIEKKKGQTASALEWLKRADAVSPNNPQVHLNLGQLYSSLNQMEKSAQHFEKALKLGAGARELSMRAELESAVKFSRGVAEAGRMTEDDLRNRARAGDLHAQMVLAGKLFDRRENDEALKWLLAAAKQGDALAQENYGRNLYRLKGASSAAEAVEWLRRAALQGYSRADAFLAKILYEGKGVPRDEVEASLWAHAGSAAGEEECRSLVQEMKLFIDPAAFAEGRKRAEAMLAKKDPTTKAGDSNP